MTKDGKKAPVFRQKTEGGDSQFILMDAPNFTDQKKSEKAVYDNYVLYDGKVIYHVHWERKKDADGTKSYPAENVKGERVDGMPKSMLDTLERDKLPDPTKTQPAPSSAPSK